MANKPLIIDGAILKAILPRIVSASSTGDAEAVTFFDDLVALLWYLDKVLLLLPMP